MNTTSPFVGMWCGVIRLGNLYHNTKNLTKMANIVYVFIKVLVAVSLQEIGWQQTVDKPQQ